MKKISFKILALVLCLTATSILAQESQYYGDKDKLFKEGLDFFNKQKYALAQRKFEEVINQEEERITDIRTDAEYYNTLCSIELFHDDSEFLISQFIKKYPENPRTKTAYFQMGRFQYRQKKYSEAINWFEKVNKYDLSPEQLEEFYFKLAYSHFSLGKKSNAEELFYEILDTKYLYAAPARYYYAHLAYENKNFETALKYFNTLKDDPTFKSVVPFYIAQIEYSYGHYEKAIEYAVTLAESKTLKRDAEINRIIGESYFKLENYQKALPYLEKYKDKAASYTRNDIFQLAFTYYKSEKYTKASETFSLVTNVADTLTQYSYYYIADCYLKDNDKNLARLSFENAAKYSFIPEIKEDAMFNYAKLTYELSYSPFNETINSFKDYIDQNPDSYRLDEAYDYLVKVYLTAKNYKEALASIEQIKQKNLSINKAYQRVAFFRALELFNNLEFDIAIQAFQKSLTQANYDRKLKALTYYWQAEAYYRLHDFDSAINNYKKFIITPGAFLLSEYNESYYNLGYGYFKQKKYPESSQWFRKFVDSYKDSDNKKMGDSYIRIGDCFFISSDYNRAISFYAKADSTNCYDYDYALFQQAFSYGLIKNYQKKIELLQQVLIDTTSAYSDDALFEIANSYIAIDSSQLGIEAFSLFIDKYSNSSYIKKALVQLALLEYNQNLNESALSHYKKVIEDYPGSAQAQDAIIGIKNIYIDLNDVDSYFAYIRKVGVNTDISTADKDSITYLAAEKKYMDGDFNLSKKAISNYVNKFPAGNFIINATYYLADCYFQLNKPDSALLLFNNIIQHPKNAFTEQSLLSAAQIDTLHHDYVSAIEKYIILENQAEIKENLIAARIGQLEMSQKLNNNRQIIQSAQKVLKTDKIDIRAKRKARFLLAKAYQELEKPDSAIANFRMLSIDVKNVIGAESKYKVAKGLYDQGKISQAENEIFNFIELNSPHQYWMAKSFIQLAQIYRDKKDNFQAKATLKSIIENYDNSEDGIIIEAESLLNDIQNKENKSFIKEGEDLEIQFEDNQKELFPRNDTIPIF